MSDPIIVNQSTSVVHVDTSTVVYPRNAVVLLSTITSPGTIITIRDVTGYASTNRGISVSTMTGVHFLDGPGCNVYNINQPYGFLTVTPRTSNVWAVLNTFAFPDQEATPSVVGIYAQFGNFSNIYGDTGTINNLTVNYSSILNVSIVSSLLAKSISTRTLAVSDTLSAVNISTSSGFFSSININNSLLPSTSLDVNGSMRASTLFITKDAYIQGSLVYNTNNIVSTVRGLGTSSYISSPSLTSTIRGLGTASYISSASLVSSIQGLGTASYVSSASLVSSIQGLGSASYISSASLISTIEGLGTAGYISSYGPGFESTVIGLGSSGYVSSFHLISSIQGLGTAGYISSYAAGLESTVIGLGSSGYVSSLHLISSIQGLGTTSYISSASLVSSIQGLGTSAYLSGPSIFVSSLSTHNFVVYGTSTFINSSNIYLGNNFSTNALRFIGTSNDGYYGDISINPHTTTVIAERIYNTNAAGPTNNSELLLFKGSHDSNTIFGPDRVRVLTTGSFQVDIASNNGVWPINGNPPSTIIEAFLINTSGRVGISCNSPQYNLDVGGSINARSISANGIPFITASILVSTVQGLGSSSYISSLNIISTVQGLGTGGYISSSSLFSTVEGLGSSSYISSLSLRSTVIGLGSSSYVSSLNLISTVQGLGTVGYISSFGNEFSSTVRGLGSAGYISTPNIIISSISSQSIVVFGDNSSTILASSNIFIGNNPSTNAIRFIGTDRDAWNGNILINPYANTVIAERLYYTNDIQVGFSELLLFKGQNSATTIGAGLDRVRVLSAGGFKIDIASNGGSWGINGNPPSSIVEAFTVISNGWVGINCNIPAYTLDINGSINVLSNIYVNGESILNNYTIISTIRGLGTAGYVSSLHLISTVKGLGSSEYVSSLHLISTVQGLGTSQYISSLTLISTIQGLGTAGYISSLLVANKINNSNMLIGNSFSTNMIRFYGTAYDNIAAFEDTQTQPTSNFYATTVIAERLYYLTPTSEGCSELLLFKGKNAAEGIGQNSGPDRVRVLTAGGFKVDIASNGGIWLSNENPPSTIIEALSVVPSGFVGINCNAPAYTLDVNGSINVSGSIISGGSLNITPNNIVSTVQGLGTASYVSSASLVSTVQGLGTASYVSSASLVSTVQGIGAVSVTPTNFVSTVQGLGTASYVSSASLVSTVEGLGSVNYVSSVSGNIRTTGNITAGGSLIATSGITSSNYITATTGNITATAGNVYGVDVIATSDFRLKTNILTIDSPLEKISAMRGVYFHKISDSTIRKVGVIAQEIEIVLPEVVFTDDTEEKMKGVSYGNITSILIEGMKAQQSSIQSLVTTISSLQAQIVLLQRTIL